MNFKLQAGEKIPDETLEKLKTANKSYSNSKNFQKYLSDLREIFQVDKVEVTTETKLFLGGFFEGEASLNVSCKKLDTALFGVIVDPEFSVTQHVNGFSTLYLALETLKAGRIRHKIGSNATLVLVIDNRQTLEEKVVPFYESYVVPYGSKEKVRRLKKFKTLLDLFNRDAHKNVSPFLNEILPIWDEMRQQRGQTNESFRSLEDAKTFVLNFIK